MKIYPTSYGIACEEGHPSSDAFAVKSWDETVMAVLSDGAGVGAAARDAAQRAVRCAIESYEVRPRAWSTKRALHEVTQLINRTLYQESLARFDRPEMVATLAAAVIEGDHLYGVNVGDSRVCLARNGELLVLSREHREEHRFNVLTQALGMSAAIEPHVFELELHEGDVAFLCSDGVANHLSDAKLAAALKERNTARTIVLAARTGAKPETMDDMSAIVLDIAETGKLRRMKDRALAIPNTLRKGEVIDGFELQRSFADADRVWLAEKDTQKVVLKFAPREAQQSEAHLDAFTRETWNAIRLTDDCFVKAWECPAQTARYYAMEFVDAPSLQRVLGSRKLSVDSAVALGQFLTNAAQSLLRRDLAHGDIKPHNILCVGDYARLTFKLVDLGSATPIFSVTSRAGTPSYLAPERFHEAPISEGTEIFAIGVTLYEALSGTLPYGQIERFQTPTFHSATRLIKLNPNVPHWLDALVMRAIAIRPSMRYQHYSELAYALAHPEQVEPFFDRHASLLERDPLKFYKFGFFLLLVISIALTLLLLLKR